MCPITQELMEDPVIAHDGHTYERRAIEEWFSHATKVGVKSPVTNEVLDSTTVIPNITLRSMILDHRNKLGKELLRICAHGAIADSTTFTQYIESGADINARDEEGNTPLLLLLKKGRDDLVRPLLKAGADVLCANDVGATARAIAARSGMGNGIAQMLLEYEVQQRQSRDTRRKHRERANSQHREEQEERHRQNASHAHSNGNGRAEGQGSQWEWRNGMGTFSSGNVNIHVGFPIFSMMHWLFAQLTGNVQQSPRTNDASSHRTSEESQQVFISRMLTLLGVIVLLTLLTL
eukprot:g280.t1